MTPPAPFGADCSDKPSRPMASLLLHWLNHELELSTHVIDIEADFASGYLFGELLHRLNQQPNLVEFVRHTSADAKVVNFCLLEPTLCHLNIHFNANVATAIMNKKKGAAIMVLYQIKMAAARISRAPTVSTKSLARSGIVPLHNRPMKLAKPTYDGHKSRMFKQSIQRHVRSISALQQEADQVADEKRKQQDVVAKKRKEKENLEAIKAARRHRAYIHSCYRKENFEETETLAWRVALQKKKAREQQQGAFLQQVMTRRREAEERRTLGLRRKVCRDLDAFEAQSGAKVTTTGCRFTMCKSTGYGRKSRLSVLDSAVDQKKYVAGATMSDDEVDRAKLLEMESDLDRMKQQRQQRERRKEMQTRRRQRFVQECVHTYTRFETAEESRILNTAVLRTTKSEDKLESELDWILAYKDVARENRMLRDQAYMKQQEMDSMAAIERDTSWYHTLLLRFKDDGEMQGMQRNDVNVSINAANHFVNEQVASAIVEDVVKFVLFIAEKREETLHTRDPAVFLSSETWNEYKTSFANGFDFDQLTCWAASEEPSQLALLDSHDFEQYMYKFQPLSLNRTLPLHSSLNDDDGLFPGATAILEDCFVLGEAVKALRYIAHVSPVVESESNVENVNREGSVDKLRVVKLDSSITRPHQQLRILVFGPPFAGKETQAKLLSASHRLALISVHELIQAAIESSSEIGSQVHALLRSGKALSPELYTRLAIEAIEKSELQDDNQAGWVIYDLPVTELQDQNLDKSLTETVDSVATSSPYDFESTIALGRPKPPLSPASFQGTAGIDLVFYLDCSSDTVLDRCLGRVEDCATGDTYRLVGEPPPQDSTVRHRLQHVNPSVCSSDLLSLYCWANDGVEHDSKAWFDKCHALHEVSCTGVSVNEVHEAMATIVDQVLKEKQETCEFKQFQQEAKEQALMSIEEDRQRRLSAFEVEIDEAHGAVAQCEASMVEAKGKKEEMAGLRLKLDEARRHLDEIMDAVRSWLHEEKGPVVRRQVLGQVAPATAHMLATVWNDMEMEYILSIKTSLAMLRKQRHCVIDHVQQVTSQFYEFVRRPDHKQEVVNAFHQLFHEVTDEMRVDALTKVALHARTDGLATDLTALVKAKELENKEELGRLVNDEWVQDMCQQVAVVYQMALQAECARYRISVQLLVDGHFAASAASPQLQRIVELWPTYRSRLDLACRMYRDLATEDSVERLAVPVTAPRAPTGKTKASTAAVVPLINATTAVDAPSSKTCTFVELLAEYTHVLQECTSWMEAIASMAEAEAWKNGKDGDWSHLQPPGDRCIVNLWNGLQYEHTLMARRVHYLQKATDEARQEVTRAMQAIERTLRDVMIAQKEQEEMAVAAVIIYVRTGIESEAALPSDIDFSPEGIELIMQLRQDMMERLSLRPLASLDGEPIHEVLVTPRQCDRLEEALIAHTLYDSGSLPLPSVVDVLLSLTSVPHALPNAWQRCPPHVLTEVVAKFTEQDSAVVDVKALIAAMSSRDDLLNQFLQDEAQLKVQRQEETELAPLLQLETTINAADGIA